MDSKDLSSLEKVKLSNVKIFSTTGSPADTVIICDGHELKEVKNIKFELDRTLLVGKITLEILTKDIYMDLNSIDTEIIEIKEEGTNESVSRP